MIPATCDLIPENRNKVQAWKNSFWPRITANKSCKMFSFSKSTFHAIDNFCKSGPSSCSSSSAINWLKTA